MSREIKLSGLSDSALEPDITPIDLTPLVDSTTTEARAPVAQPEVETTTTVTTTTTQVKKLGGTATDSTPAPPTSQPPPPPQPSQPPKSSTITSFVQQQRTTTSTNDGERNVPITAVVPLHTSSSSSSPYKSNISPRHTVITRRNIDRGTNNYSNNYSSSHSSTLITSNAIQLRPTSVPTSASGLQLRETRQREKQQLCELNDRFASYVERVRFLEAQNKKLQMELTSLKGKWGHETKQIENMYQIELDEARSVLNETSKLKDGLQLKLDKSEHDLEQIRRKYNEIEGHIGRDKDKIQNLQDKIAANDAEIGTYY